MPETQSKRLKAAEKASPPSSFIQTWTNPEVKGQWELCDLDDGGTNESIPTGSQSSSFCDAQRRLMEDPVRFYLSTVNMTQYVWLKSIRYHLQSLITEET